MACKKKSPGPEATGRWAKSGENHKSSRQHAPTSDERKAENIVWIHVLPDGEERRFAEPPDDRPRLRVEVRGDVEITWVRHQEVRVGFPYPLVPACPRGKGWVWQGADKQASEWHRPARKVGA
jgi:hypothetical protein